MAAPTVTLDTIRCALIAAVVPVKGGRDPADSPIVTPPTTPSSATSTCPRCGSAVRAGSDWCTLCFADLRPVPPPRLPQAPVAAAPAHAAVAVSPDAAGSTLTAPAAAPKRDAQLPCPRCGEPVLLSIGSCESCGAGLFDQLKGSTTAIKIPLFGDVMLMSQGARAGLAFGVAVVVVALLFVLVELFGKL